MKNIGSMKVPDNTKAILWDMDGVVIDSLGPDVQVSSELIKKYFGESIILPRNYIASIFGYPVPIFWQLIFERIKNDFGISADEQQKDKILKEYEKNRQNYPFTVLPGVEQALTDSKKNGITNAIVSNNPVTQVNEILERAQIRASFDIVVGNDSKQGMRNKPSPDMYEYAMKQLAVAPENVVVVEDSLIGAEAGKRAGCFTIGVATGALSNEDIRKAPKYFDLIV